MKYSLLYLILAVIGVGLTYYSINFLPLLGEGFLEFLETRDVTTQAEASRYFIRFYTAGTLMDYLELRSVIAVAAGGFMTIVGAIGFFHLLIDKLFYKKHYEEPNYYRSLRRSIFWGLVFVLIYGLGIYYLVQLTVLALIVLIAALIEIIASSNAL